MRGRGLCGGNGERDAMEKKRKILVVEDNPINRKVLGKILSESYETLEAGNGQEALDILRENGLSISLIMLDLSMPVMDGYTFLEHMRLHADYMAIPVIVVTQSSGEEDEVTSLLRGATDFITKPYRPQVILRRVASMIALREAAALISEVERDRLTGLYSQEIFYQRVRQTLERNPDRQYDIICSDVENFKFVNDVFGTAEGDRLLRLVGQAHQEMGGQDALCGRLRADLFASLVERRARYDPAEFQRIGERIQEQTPVKHFTLKWGVCRISGPELQVEQMCDRAILAIGTIKGQYGKVLAYYNDELRRKSLREQAITESMEMALHCRQFLVYLQPKYNMLSGRICGAEALVRWRHPQMGFLTPGEFIPLFERNGFITQLDQYVWEETCRCIRDWIDRGLPTVPVSVNVSRADVYNSDLPRILGEILERYRLEPSSIHLEITETAYTEDPEQLINVVTLLREQGYILEMDDFGSGYSSLNMLNEMPIDILKLDLRFLRSSGRNAARGNSRRGILSFVMSLARWLGIQVIAEGVETADHVRQLRDVGFLYAQGYYFSQPLPVAEFEKYLWDVDDWQEETREEAALMDQTQMLREAAFRDYLTSLLNRRGLHEKLSGMDLAGGGAAVCVFDIDNFKACNDAYGHDGGDELLQRFAQELRVQTREGDVLARIGGDEFVVVMPGMTAMDTVRQRAEKICRSLRHDPANGRGVISCSAGVAIMQPGEEFSTAFKRADVALYQVKHAGTGGCCLAEGVSASQ